MWTYRWASTSDSTSLSFILLTTLPSGPLATNSPRPASFTGFNAPLMTWLDFGPMISKTFTCSRKSAISTSDFPSAGMSPLLTASRVKEAAVCSSKYTRSKTEGCVQSHITRRKFCIAWLCSLPFPLLSRFDCKGAVSELGFQSAVIGAMRPKG